MKCRGLSAYFRLTRFSLLAFRPVKSECVFMPQRHIWTVLETSSNRLVSNRLDDSEVVELWLRRQRSPAIRSVYRRDMARLKGVSYLWQHLTLREDVLPRAADRPGERVMESLTRFIMSKLKLQVNQQKSAVARPWARKFLGFSFTSAGTPKRRIAPKAVGRFKERIRELTGRNRGVSIERMAEELSRYLGGWIGYFGKCETPSVLAGLEQWLRRRLRSAIWKQWKRGPARFAELRRRAVNADLAAQTAGSDHGPWRLADSPALSIALPNAYFDSLGIPRLTVKPIA